MVVSAHDGSVAAGRIDAVYQQHYYRRFVSTDPRVVGPAALVGAAAVAAAATLALATPLPAVAGVGIGLLSGVLVWVGLSLRQAAAQERARRAAVRQARGVALKSLAPVQLAADEQNLRTLLSPEQALITLQASMATPRSPGCALSRAAGAPLTAVRPARRRDARDPRARSCSAR